MIYMIPVGPVCTLYVLEYLSNVSYNEVWIYDYKLACSRLVFHAGIGPVLNLYNLVIFMKAFCDATGLTFVAFKFHALGKGRHAHFAFTIAWPIGHPRQIEMLIPVNLQAHLSNFYLLSTEKETLISIAHPVLFTDIKCALVVRLW